MPATEATFQQLTELTDDSIFDDLSAHMRQTEASYVENPETVIEKNLRAMGQDPRAADSKVIEEGYIPHRLQKMVHHEILNFRFTVLVCHRRWGKTVLAINSLCDAAVRHNGYLGKPGRFAYIAPLLKQAKQVAWMYLKAFAARVEGSRKHEGELYVEFPNGSRITLYGTDNAEAMRGIFLDGAVFDEPADIKPHVWPEIVRQCISDHEGWVLFIGTPRGINMFSERYDHACAEDDWASFMFRCTETNLPWLPQVELDSIRNELTDAQWRQEMLCDFGASSDDVIISIDTVTDAVARVTPKKEYLYGMEKVVGIDPAWMGSDSTAISFRWGLHLYPIQVFPHSKHDQVVGALTRIKAEHDPDAWFMDQAYGEGIFARAKMVGIDIELVAFGGDAHNKTQFGNRVTEMYFKFNDWLRAGGKLPDDFLLKAELTSIRYKMVTRGKYDVRMRLPKDELKMVIGRSPDRADSAVLTVADIVEPRSAEKKAGAVEVSDGEYHPHKRLKKSLNHQAKSPRRKS